MWKGRHLSDISDRFYALATIVCFALPFFIASTFDLLLLRWDREVDLAMSCAGSGAMSRSAEIPSPPRTRRTMSNVSGRFPVRISDTRARLPIKGSRSLRLS